MGSMSVSAGGDSSKGTVSINHGWFDLWYVWLIGVVLFAIVLAIVIGVVVYMVRRQK
ncbi:COX2_TM domain-containing protein [Caenorhabditis elegans]|uniref:COX2_TM domain-containing protein n=1 Tax=Caenorhabditis elegans TaxID=6239 RepID=U4PS93_CAEEL|nr:COX2_TM domain-containing protein [Caenorhabditis elegans]CDH93465.1 COX2_TM domain-containing protein [Caenorhabditis elegans]|eukprot:NP_001294638.1 Uncharacterized protein CELE_F56D6.19 [Caenorhabditis elegans]